MAEAAPRPRPGYYSTGGSVHVTMGSDGFRSHLSDVTLMLLGKTGSGKSSLGNVILNRSGQEGFPVTHGLASTPCYKADARETSVHDRQVKVVDTPGVMDTNYNEELVLHGISDGISLCPEGVDAFLLVLKFGRLTLEEFLSIDKLEILFGQELWRHVILVFTHGDHVQYDSKSFQKMLDDSKKQIPNMQILLSKLTTDPQLVDASMRAGGTSDAQVVAGQMNRLILTVDMLVQKNKAKKYTNDIFATVKSELASRKNAELQTQNYIANTELECLWKKISKLEEDRQRIETMKVEDEKKIKDLQEQNKKMESMLEEERQKAKKLEQRAKETTSQLEKSRMEAVRLAAALAKKKCHIL